MLDMTKIEGKTFKFKKYKDISGVFYFEDSSLYFKTDSFEFATIIKLLKGEKRNIKYLRDRIVLIYVLKIYNEKFNIITLKKFARKEIKKLIDGILNG